MLKITAVGSYWGMLYVTWGNLSMYDIFAIALISGVFVAIAHQVVVDITGE